MTVPNNKTPETRPNHVDRIGEIMEKLKKGERVELHDIGLDERIRAEKFMEKSKENLNLAIRISKDKITVRSGGYEIQIKDNRVIVYGKDGGVVHEYVNECLAKNLTTLLLTVLAKYNLLLYTRWYVASLPREKDREVRKLQSWILALITNFSKPLKNNPLICT
jgi:DNA primase